MIGQGRLDDLAELFHEISEAIAAAAPKWEAASALVQIAVSQVPAAEHAGVSVGTVDGGFSTLAATSELARQVDAIQYQLSSGPCVDAITDTPLVRTGDLAADERWPVFGPRATRETGVTSMLSHRLFIEIDAESVAALNFYSTRRDAFTDADEPIAIVLAAHGARAVARAAAANKADNLMIALLNSREIGIAMGILMDRFILTRDQAFDVLRVHSQATHRKVADVATELADTGALPPRPQPRSRDIDAVQRGASGSGRRV